MGMWMQQKIFNIMEQTPWNVESRQVCQGFPRILWNMICINQGPLTPYVTALVNPLTPNDHYSGRTAPLTSKRCILYIYSTNIGTEYFKRSIYSSFFIFKMQFVS